MKRYFVCVIVLLACVACGETFKQEVFDATVHDLRITRSQITTNTTTEGDPVGGALVGGIIAGTPGAILGAASEASKTRRGMVKNDITACGFSADGDGHVLIFRTTKYALHCSLLKDGDVIKITKVIQGWEGTSEKKITYYWYVEEDRNPYNPEIGALHPEMVR
jgi:hypothetical protein